MAVHVDTDGRAYCTYYKIKSSKVTSKRHRANRLYDRYKIDLDDGEWHKIEMSYKPSNTKGYCKIVIDG